MKHRLDAYHALKRLPRLRAIGFVEFVCEPGRLALPDFACDLIWLDGRLVVVGPMTRGLVVDIADRRVALAALCPLEARQLLGCPLSELTDQIIPIHDIAPSIANPLEDLFAAGHAARLIKGSTGFDPASLTQGDDGIIVSAMRHLNYGASTERVAHAHDVSDRHLRRLFQEFAGMSPGAYARIRRFRRAVSAAMRGESLAASSHGAGYVDQSHFNRESRRLTGLTPREVLASLGGGGEVVALARQD